MIAIASERSTTFRDARITVLRSEAISRLVAGGMFAPQLRKHGPDAVDGVDDVGLGLPRDDDDDRGKPPLESPMLRRSSTESLTVATSPSLTGEPLR